MTPTPREVRDMFAEILAEMDANPRPVSVKALADFEIELDRGEPVFTCGGESLRANFRGRWLAEHPVPLRVRTGDRIRFLPTTANRVKVREGGCRLVDRLRAWCAAIGPSSRSSPLQDED